VLCRCPNPYPQQDKRKQRSKKRCAALRNRHCELLASQSFEIVKTPAETFQAVTGPIENSERSLAAQLSESASRGGGGALKF